MSFPSQLIFPGNIITEPLKMTVESIPLPFASIAFSDNYHAALLRNMGVDGGIIMFARPGNSYYVASKVSLNEVTRSLESELSNLCIMIKNDLINFNGAILPVDASLSHFPMVKEEVEQHDYKFLRVYKINDFLASNGYWIMFFKDLNNARAIGPIIKRSISSPQFRDAITDTVTSAMNSQATDEMIANWVTLLDKRDKETEEHTLRVSHLAVLLGKKAGLNQEELVNLRRGALLHDIGKIVIPNEILYKPGSLTEPEWKIMRLHPKIVKDLLGKFSIPEELLEIPYYHHEKWDGSGYPAGLAGEEIPFFARIFSLADVFDAMISDRPYRTRFAVEEVIEHIKNQSGKHFDPELTKLFIQLVEEKQIGEDWN